MSEIAWDENGESSNGEWCISAEPPRDWIMVNLSWADNAPHGTMVSVAEARAIAARLLALADQIDPPVDERQALFDNAYSPDQPRCPGCGCHPNGYHADTCDAMKKLQGHA